MRTKRIQRSRKRGWRMPANAVYVGRPSKWGNPFKISEMNEPGTDRRENAVLAFRVHVLNRHAEIRRELHGKNLVCWCPLDQPCHADVLLELAAEVSKRRGKGALEADSQLG